MMPHAGLIPVQLSRCHRAFINCHDSPGQPTVILSPPLEGDSDDSDPGLTPVLAPRFSVRTHADIDRAVLAVALLAGCNCTPRLTRQHDGMLSVVNLWHTPACKLLDHAGRWA